MELTELLLRNAKYWPHAITSARLATISSRCSGTPGTLDESVVIQNGITKRIRFAEIKSVSGEEGTVWIMDYPAHNFLADQWKQGAQGVKPEWDIEVRISQKGARSPLVSRYTVTIAPDYTFSVKEHI